MCKGKSEEEAAALYQFLTITLHPLSAALPPPMRLVLSAGDVLRLPAFWMHHVTSLAPTVSLNVFADYSGVREALQERMAAGVSAGECVVLIEERLKNTWSVV